MCVSISRAFDPATVVISRPMGVYSFALSIIPFGKWVSVTVANRRLITLHRNASILNDSGGANALIFTEKQIEMDTWKKLFDFDKS